MQSTTTVAPNRQRSLGVSFLAIIVALQGIGLLMIEGIRLVSLLAAFARDGVLLADVVFVGVFAAALVLIAALLLVVAWGLWTLKPWAFWLTVVTQLMSLLSSVGLLVQSGDTTSTLR